MSVQGLSFGKRMYKSAVFLLLVFIGGDGLMAQNVGIGNTNPAYKLDLSGRMRIRGGTDDNFTAGLWLTGIANDTTTNKMFLGMESDSTAGFYSELGNRGWFLVANGRDGNIGIRNRSPKFPLSFDDQGGDKISLYRDGNGNYYGLGIGNAAMQLMTPSNTTHILFGYGKSGSFTENMRLTGTGELIIGATAANQAPLTVNKKTGAIHALFGSNTTGMAIESNFPGIGFNSYYNNSRKTISTGYSGYIGVNPISGGMQLLVSSQSNNTDVAGTYKTAFDIKADGKVGLGVSDPGYLLDVGDRMRIRSTTGYSAGLWLNNDNNTATPAFIGMNSNTQVGFYGAGTGWSFLMDTQTGAISFGGNAGLPGQVLTSNGTGGAPVWQGGAGGGKYFVVRPSSNSPILTSSSNPIDVPGLVANFTLTAPSQVVFNYRVRVANLGCVACGERRTFVRLVQNVVGGTTDISSLTVYTPNNEHFDGVSGPIEMSLAAGTYSFKIAIASSIYGAASVVAVQEEGILTWQIFPN